MAAATSVHDFIVVGGGSAGCVLAARLSKDENARVLLLEAGDRVPLEHAAVPPAWTTLLGSSMDWGTSTVELAATGVRCRGRAGTGWAGRRPSTACSSRAGIRPATTRGPTPVPQDGGMPTCSPTSCAPRTPRGRDSELRGVGGPLTVAPARPPHR